MDAQEIIQFIQKAEKKTPVKVYLNVTEPIEFEHGKVFGEGKSQIVFGDYNEIAPILQKESEKIIDIEIEVAARNSAVPLLDLKTMNARIEPGAIIRDLDLKRPIYAPTAAYGHFGRTDIDLPWERTDRVDELRKAAGL